MVILCSTGGLETNHLSLAHQTNLLCSCIDQCYLNFFANYFLNVFKTVYFLTFLTWHQIGFIILKIRVENIVHFKSWNKPKVNNVWNVSWYDLIK